MRTLIADHPLIEHKLTLLRDVDTTTPVFAALVDELTALLGYEATRSLVTEPIEVTTPLSTARGVRLAQPRPMVVPILRAGLGMLGGMRRLLPQAEVGFLGMVRDEESLVAHTYADRLPADLTGRQLFLLDPMLATGGTLVAAIDLLLERGAHDVTVICLLAAPEGMLRLQEAYSDRDVRVACVCAGLDARLNDQGYIVPGLGDAGDRLYGVV
jgi:uracil phosphoribosyltransferase